MKKITVLMILAAALAVAGCSKQEAPAAHDQSTHQH